MTPLLFALTLGLLLMTPGPTNTLLALAGAARRSGWATCCMGAELAGYLTTVLPVHFLAAPYLAAHPGTGRVIAAVCALWVATLAGRLWDAPIFSEHRGPVTPRLVYITTVFNPKGLVIALSLLPASLDATFLQCLALMLVLIPAAASLWLTMGAGLIRKFGERHPALVMRIASSALLLFSAGLAGKAAGLL